MKKNSRIITLLMVLMVLLTTVGFSSVTQAATTNLDMHVIDVGQADSIYIKLPNGQNMLIDGGNTVNGPTVVSYLQSQGVSKVDYVVGTHPHADHIGGLTDVINSFDIGKIYMPNKTATTTEYTNLINAINAKGLYITTAKAGLNMFNTTANSKLLVADIISPAGTSYSDVNDFSAVIRLTYGSTSIMLTGDAGTTAEAEMINSGKNLSASILKVGHHGSSTASSDAFLTKVNPTSSVISVGLNNSYGLPTQQTIDRLKAHNIDIFRTDSQGTIIYTTSGTDFTVNNTPWWQGTDGGTPSNVIINEVLPAPQTNYNNEFVELYNPDSSAVDISGYVIDDIVSGGGAPHTIPNGTSIAANGYWVWETNSYFNNAGDDVTLSSASGTQIDKYTYGSSSYDKSWIRLPDGGAWQSTMSSTPTKGALNQ